MRLDLEAIRKDGYEVYENFDDDLFVIKQFAQKELCVSSVKKAHETMKVFPHRKEHNGVFYSFDVLPSNTKTDRIFRTITFKESKRSILESDFVNLFDLLSKFQNKYVLNTQTIEENKVRRLQLIHYPKGGGFFDWHSHPRYPVNYGLILNLSEKGTNFNEGATEILRNNEEKICVEEFSDIVDLILFKFDLRHRVAPCNPKDDMVFDVNGRWTAVMPIY